MDPEDFEPAHVEFDRRYLKCLFTEADWERWEQLNNPWSPKYKVTHWWLIKCRTCNRLFSIRRYRHKQLHHAEKGQCSACHYLGYQYWNKPRCKGCGKALLATPDTITVQLGWCGDCLVTMGFMHPRCRGSRSLGLRRKVTSSMESK